jgi:hypothetical protein
VHYIIVPLDFNPLVENKMEESSSKAGMIFESIALENSDDAAR